MVAPDPSIPEIDAVLYALALPDAHDDVHARFSSSLIAEVIALRDAAALLAFALGPEPPGPRARQRLDAALDGPRRRMRPRAATLIAGLGVASAAAATALWLGARGEVHAVDRRLGALEARLGPVRAPDLTLATFRGKDAGIARVLASPTGRQWLVVAFELPAVTDRDYQLWFVPAAGGDPISAGLLEVGPGGVLDASVTVPAGLGALRPAISLEPRGGSRTPTDVKLVGEPI